MNTAKDKDNPLEQACRLLEASGLPTGPALREALARYVALIQELNPVLSLVSLDDARHLMARHAVDSLSLVPWVVASCGPKGRLLDIGSGGGFPAIPLKAALPDLSVTLVERSVKKAGFLRRVIGALGLQGISVLVGEYPAVAESVSAELITARAVERPDRLMPGILERVAAGEVFLCQNPLSAAIPGEMFHVERLEDRWTESGLRRGELFRVRRRT